MIEWIDHLHEHFVDARDRHRRALPARRGGRVLHPDPAGVTRGVLVPGRTRVARRRDAVTVSPGPWISGPLVPGRLLRMQPGLFAHWVWLTEF